MPEGDTIHRIAARLQPIVNTTIESATTQGLVRDSLVGRTIAAVSAHGKHLVIDLQDGTQIRTHLGMYGRFLTLGREHGELEVHALSPGRVSLALVTSARVLVWLGARTVEISSRRAPMRGMSVATLGPDVLAPGFDPDAAATRAATADPGRSIAEVLLDQRVVAGIGNVYKSESLFACGVDPRTPIAALDHATLVRIYATNCTQMHANLGDAPRRTRPSSEQEPYFVYGRTHRPCVRCGAAIECYALGATPRWTWSCPRCQPPWPRGDA